MVEPAFFSTFNLSNPLLGLGAGGDRKIVQAQDLLNLLGYKCFVDGIFGEETENNVKQFQKDNNLPQNGVLNSQTIDKLKVKAKELLETKKNKYNAKNNGFLIGEGYADNNFLVDVQSKLKEKRFYKGEVDGIYGTETETAVADFQSANGLIADGIIGPRTEELIFK